MIAIRIISVFLLIVSFLGLVVGIIETHLLAPAAALGFSGLLLLALDNILLLLADIKQGINDLSPESQRQKAVGEKADKSL